MNNNLVTAVFILIIVIMLVSIFAYYESSHGQVSEENNPSIYGCAQSRWGCCPDWLTYKQDPWGSNCRPQMSPQPPSQTTCNSPDYYFDESRFSNRCYDNCQCDGLRTCSQWKWCQGTAR